MYYHSKNQVDWLSTRGEKMLQPQNVYTFWKKDPEVKKNIWFLHFMTIFQNFALKIETGWAKKVVQPFFETRNVNYVCMNVLFINSRIKI